MVRLGVRFPTKLSCEENPANHTSTGKYFYFPNHAGGFYKLPMQCFSLSLHVQWPIFIKWCLKLGCSCEKEQQIDLHGGKLTYMVGHAIALGPSAHHPAH